MQTESGERRSSPRYPIHVPIRFRSGGESGEDARARVGDISLGGVSFASSEPISEGSRIEIEFPIAAERFSLTGSVVQCREEDATGTFRVGLRFVEPEMQFRLKLAEQVARIHELRRELTYLRDEPVSIEEAAREWVKHYAREFAELYAP